MKTFTRGAILALVVAITFTAPSKSWGQGQGGGGSGTGSGGSTVQQAAGALYGDLYVIERKGNGEPWLRTITATGGPYTCQQPLAVDCSFLLLNADKGTNFDPEEEDACAVQAGDTVKLQAVSFGRESVARAPSTVLDKSYGEAIKSINLAGNNCSDPTGRAIKLDPAGRITLCLPLETDPVTYAWKTIDAPLENLGLYRELMTSGCFNLVKDTSRGEEGTIIYVYYVLSDTAKGNLKGSGLGHLVCEGTPPIPQTEPTPHETVTKADMLSAAVFLAAGADKASPVTLDEIINLNNYVGANTWTYTTVRKVKTLNITYFQFTVPTDGVGAKNWFGYTNGVDACVVGAPDNTVALLTKGGGLTFVQNNSVSVFGGYPPGVNLDDAAVTVCRAGFPLKVAGSSLNVVCDNAAPKDPETNPPNPVWVSDTEINGCGGANWFTQAAEDARKTIWYLHNWRVPVVAY